MHCRTASGELWLSEAMKTIAVWTVVQTLELDPIPVANGSPLVFRVEVLRRSRQRFRWQIWRLESHRLQPSFARRQADVEVPFREEHLSPKLEFETAKAAGKAAIRALEKQLRVRILSPTR